MAVDRRPVALRSKRDTSQNLRTSFNKIIRRAGLTPWPEPFQNLRASRETELAAAYPLHVVCAWIGKSTLIAQKHYLQTNDDDFRQAAKSGAKSGAARSRPQLHRDAISFKNAWKTGRNER